MRAAQTEINRRNAADRLRSEVQQILENQGRAACIAVADPEFADQLILSIRVDSKEAKAVLLSLPERKTHGGHVYSVDATAKSLGAGVYELTFTATLLG